MCARYEISMELEDELLEQIIAAFNRRERRGNVRQSGEIFPADIVPAVARSRSGARDVFAMQWGYTLQGKRVINARSETAHERPLFADGIANRRCLIPGSWYYEWHHSAPGHPKLAIRPRGATGILLAGIYRIEQNQPVFAVLTRKPEGALRDIHDRMPVMLPPEMVADWLNPAYQPQELLAHALTDVEITPVRGASEQLAIPLD